jgi:hypothetical protein
MESVPVKSQASFPYDCLPPEGEYESRDALLTAINAWARPKRLRVHKLENQTKNIAGLPIH